MFGVEAFACALWLGCPGVLLGDTLAMPMNGSQLARQLGSKVECTRNLLQIAMASHAWSTDNADQLPPSLQDLAYVLASPAPLFCPANFHESIPTNWADVDWAKIDYTWNASADARDPSAIICTCRIHENAARVDGSIAQGGFRPGWPLITAGLKSIVSTPGEEVRFEFRVSSNAFQPQLFQWRREHIEYVTNVVQLRNPDFPTEFYWVTNVLAEAVGTNLPAQTNAALLLTNVQGADTALYRVTVSNELGTSSSYNWLKVRPEYAGYSTNDSGSFVYCVNNLKMFALLFGVWAIDHNNEMLPGWAALTNQDGSLMFGWPESLYCRADKQRNPPPDWTGVDLNNTSYELLPTNPADLLAPYCRCRVHGFYVEAGGEVVSRPRLNAVTPLPGGDIRLTYKVFADRTNILEASPDLINWETLKTHSPTNGEFEFVDADKLQRRFYRLKLP